MEAVEFIKEYRRMCMKYAYIESCGEECSDECPLFDSGYCELGFDNLEPSYIVSKVKQWSQAHPQKTMTQDFFEKFPNALKDSFGNPMVCPQTLGYGDFCCDDTKNNCTVCWSRPLEE